MSDPQYIDFEQYLLDNNNDDFYMFCDNDTYDVVYLNQAMCNHLNIELERAISNKCYSVLYDRNAPCPYCVAPELNQGIFKSVEVTYPLKEERIDCCVSLMQYKDQTIRVNRYINTNLDGKELISSNNDILTKLINSVDNGEFVTYYQPKFCINTNDIIGAEAFVRKIRQEDNSIVMPIDFLPLYENQAIIKHLDLEVLKQVCKTQAEWLRLGKKIKIDVNMSTLTLTEKGIDTKIKQICDDFNIPYDLICIGITDDKNLSNCINLIQNNTSKLVASGFGLAIDNFGLEHYNINTLIKIDFSEIKFCKLLLKDIEKNEKNQIIVKNIIEMCSQMNNMTTLALGIETKEQEEFIKTLSPSFVQGYLYSRPLTDSDFFDKYLK